MFGSILILAIDKLLNASYIRFSMLVQLRLPIECIAERLSALRKDLVEIMLKPPDIRREAGKLPHSVNLLVPVLVSAMSMAFDQG